MKNYIFFLILINLAVYSELALAQRTTTPNPVNTTLYLKMDKTKPRQGVTNWNILNGLEEKLYIYDNYAYLHSMLTFRCSNRNYVKSIPISTLGNYSLKTLEDLEVYFATLTSTQIKNYMEGLTKIYIIEVFPNSTMAELVPVVLYIHIY